MPRMTPEREASLPRADPVWVNLNKELWASKDVIRKLEQENQGENASSVARFSSSCQLRSRCKNLGDSKNGKNVNSNFRV